MRMAAPGSTPLGDRRPAVAVHHRPWPTTATGARSQRPRRARATTRTSGPSRRGSSRRAARPRQGAGQPVADPDGQRRAAGLALPDDVEVGVERGDLVDLGQRQPHLLGERGEVRGRQMAVLVLDQVQVLDQQIAPARAVAEQRADLVERLRIDLPALGRAARAVARGRLGRLAIVGSRGE